MSENDKLQQLLTNLKKQYKDVNDSYVYTASKDGGGELNQKGQYMAGAAFCNTNGTFYSPTDTTASGGTENAYGYECGGTIQVYASIQDAVNEIAYLKSVTIEPNTRQCMTNHGNSECSYTQFGNTVVHVSDMHTDSQQADYLKYISQQITNLSI